MPTNRVFFPQGLLARWLDEGKVDLTDESLTLRDKERTQRYRIVEAIRIVSELTGSPDPHKLEGRVKSRAFLAELGAEIVGDSMLVGDNAYDIVEGFTGTPILAAPAETEPTPPPSAPSKPPQEAKTDEELLVKFLLKGL